MVESPLKFVVLLSKPEAAAQEAVAEALARAGLAGERGRDARWGILAEGLVEAEAKGLAERLGGAGLPARPLPESLLEELPPPEPVSKAALMAGGLVLDEGGAPGVMIPWKRLVLAAAAGFRRLERRRVIVEEVPGLLRRALAFWITLATGLPPPWAGHRRLYERTVETSEIVYFVDLIFAGPPRRLRLDLQDFDFSCLGAHKVLDLFGNVRSLVAEISRLAPKAALGRGAEVLLGGKPLRETGHGGLEDLELECRWRLTLEALKT